jgi:hypothetical protein
MRKNLRGSMAREDIYKIARALSRDTSPSSKRLPKYPPYQQILTLNLLPALISCRAFHLFIVALS